MLPTCSKQKSLPWSEVVLNAAVTPPDKQGEYVLDLIWYKNTEGT